MVEKESEETKVKSLFSNYRDIASMCTLCGVVAFAVWGVMIMGAQGYQVGFVLIVFGYLLNWLLHEWEAKNKLRAEQKELIAKIQ